MKHLHFDSIVFLNLWFSCDVDVVVCRKIFVVDVCPRYFDSYVLWILKVGLLRQWCEAVGSLDRSLPYIIFTSLWN